RNDKRERPKARGCARKTPRVAVFFHPDCDRRPRISTGSADLPPETEALAGSCIAPTAGGDFHPALKTFAGPAGRAILAPCTPARCRHPFRSLWSARAHLMHDHAEFDRAGTRCAPATKRQKT